MPLISDVTAALIGKVLDLESLRADTASRNIANANVAGYQPQQVDFDSQLASVREGLGTQDALEAAVTSLDPSSVQPSPEVPQSLLGANVSLDGEITTLTLANARYESLVESLNRHFGLMNLAITGRE